MMATSRSWTAAPTARTNSSLARSLLVFSFIFFAARRKLLSRISSAVGTVGIFSNSTNLQPIYFIVLEVIRFIVMELSLVQKDILITLITLYHQHSRSIKGEDIAAVSYTHLRAHETD